MTINIENLFHSMYFFNYHIEVSADKYKWAKKQIFKLEKSFINYIFLINNNKSWQSI